MGWGLSNNASLIYKVHNEDEQMYDFIIIN